MSVEVPNLPKTLAEWLTFAENISVQPIELGLERMRTMVSRLSIHFDCPVFTVAGTNGKGSTCAMLESILRSEGYRVGMHTSPHLIRFNERAILDGKEVGDEALCSAFAEVERCRQGSPLTYFEFTGLAILKLFSEQKLDAVILEIGLGGRLDAMNVIDASCGIVCAVGIDHTAYLGSTRELIAAEKACIYRSGKPAVVTDRDPPETLVSYAAQIGAPLSRYGREYDTVEREDSSFDFVFGDVQYERLPRPALCGRNQIQNAAGVLCALTLLKSRLPVSRRAIEEGLRRAYMPGRFETLQLPLLQGIPLCLDVGHNPQAARALLENIRSTQRTGEKLLAVFAMLRDKDMRSVAQIMAETVAHWFVAPLSGPRGANLEELTQSMQKAGIPDEKISRFETTSAALKEAICQAKQLKNCPVRILVFGSFVTVGSVVHSLGELESSLEEKDLHAG